MASWASVSLIVLTQTLLLIHFRHITLCVTDTLPPNYIPGNTDSCIDNTKWILLSPVLKCLPVPLTGKKKKKKKTSTLHIPQKVRIVLKRLAFLKDCLGMSKMDMTNTAFKL